MYTSPSLLSQQKKENLKREVSLVGNCKRTRKSYHRHSKDVPCQFKGQLKKLFLDDREIIALRVLYRMQRKIDFQPIYSSYRFWSQHLLSDMNLSERTVRRIMNKLTNSSIIQKSSPTAEQIRFRGIKKKDSTLCWSINYEHLETLGITKEYLERVLYNDRRITVKNPLFEKKIGQPSKITPLTNNKIITLSSPKKSILKKTDIIPLEKTQMEELLTPEKLVLNENFRSIALVAGYLPSNIPYAFRTYIVKTYLKAGTHDSYEKDWKKWCNNAVEKGWHMNSGGTNYSDSNKSNSRISSFKASMTVSDKPGIIVEALPHFENDWFVFHDLDWEERTEKMAYHYKMGTVRKNQKNQIVLEIGDKMFQITPFQEEMLNNQKSSEFRINADLLDKHWKNTQANKPAHYSSYVSPEAQLRALLTKTSKTVSPTY